MANFSYRRAACCALPPLFAALLILGPGQRAPSPYWTPASGTDVFGAGTGGISNTGTSVYQTPGDITGWGISTMKPLTPPPPDPESTAAAPAPSFGAEDIGPSDIRGGDDTGDDFGGALAPLDQH